MTHANIDTVPKMSADDHSHLFSKEANSTPFDSLKQQVATVLETDLIALLDAAMLPTQLYEACRYALLGNGKRARPLLLASSYLTVKAAQNATQDSVSQATDSISLNQVCRRAMMAVELLHTYSLIHDDLPCMDDDALRRGRATCHIAFDEATALLAGDVLQTLAFEALTMTIEGFSDVTAATSLALNQLFAPRARRMVVGQALDLQAENQTIDQIQLEAIHKDKTGALIEAAVLMGAVCGFSDNMPDQHNLADKTNHSEDFLQDLEQFAAHIGLAFQVQDDILDVTASTDTLGKPAGSDEKLNKSTYVKLMGVAMANDYAKSLFDAANASLNSSFGQHTALQTVVDWLWARKK